MAIQGVVGSNPSLPFYFFYVDVHICFAMCCCLVAADAWPHVGILSTHISMLFLVLMLARVGCMVDITCEGKHAYI